MLRGIGLAVLAALSTAPRSARGAELAATEPTPVEELGPPQRRGAAVEIVAAGVTVRIPASHRSAQVIARWRLRAAPSVLQLTVPSSLRQVTFAIEGRDPAPDREAAGEPTPAAPDGSPSPGVEIEAVEELTEGLAAVPEVRIDPASGRPYATAPGESRPGRVAHQITVQIPPSGEVVLRASVTLSSGFDRQHYRRTHFEQAHALQKRHDPFVYQFAVRGPAGPVHLDAPPDTVASARLIDGVLHAAAAARRPLPLGLTLGLGPAVSSLPPTPPGGSPSDPSGPAPTLLVQGVLRASLEASLPNRDALALSLEAGSDLHGGHHAGGALVYQLYTPVWPYLPIGGHLDAGVSCDFWQSRGMGLGLPGAPTLRCGPRLGFSANVAFLGLSPSVDVFPLRESAVSSTETRWTAQYRVAILGTVGL